MANLILAPGMPSTVVNLDQWHGYPASRRRFLDFLRTRGASNVVVLTGDLHSSWANELVLDPADPAQYDPAPAGARSRSSSSPPASPARASRPPTSASSKARALQPAPALVRSGPAGIPGARRDPGTGAGGLVPLRRHQASRSGAAESFAAAWSVESGSLRLGRTAPPRPRPTTRPPPAPRLTVDPARSVCYEDGLRGPSNPARAARLRSRVPDHARRPVPPAPAPLPRRDGDARRLPARAEPHRLAVEGGDRRRLRRRSRARHAARRSSSSGSPSSRSSRASRAAGSSSTPVATSSTSCARSCSTACTASARRSTGRCRRARS